LKAKCSGGKSIQKESPDSLSTTRITQKESRARRKEKNKKSRLQVKKKTSKVRVCSGSTRQAPLECVRDQGAGMIRTRLQYSASPKKKLFGKKHKKKGKKKLKNEKGQGTAREGRDCGNKHCSQGEERDCGLRSALRESSTIKMTIFKGARMLKKT